MKIKTTLYIQARKSRLSDDFKIEVNSYKMESGDIFGICIDIDQKEIEVECPEFEQSNFTKGYIDQLREIKRNHLVESHQKTKSLDEQIENLLALENKA